MNLSVGKIITRSELETTELGRIIGMACSGGELIRLIGPLGAGKSVLARGIARGLGIEGPIRSPSFNLMREYHGRLILRHWDLFRLDEGFSNLGLLESVDEQSVVIVEWAEKWRLLEQYASGTIMINYSDMEHSREIEWRGKVPGLSW